jgi:S-adenosyl-L-methionine hydrolase (adenosine-forming)
MTPLNVFFLSDYGTQDEFVGVVHAVLAAASPGVTVIDLTHQIAAFDIRAGASTLERVVPHLGQGVVLAVVDPGVGSARRGVCLEVEPDTSRPRSAPRFFVGPDNGLLMAAAELVGGGSITRAIELLPDRHRFVTPSLTFDGRDLFAPAAAALSGGLSLEDLGAAIDPASLVRLPRPVVVHGRLADGRRSLQAEVVWVDRFGNLALAATSIDAEEAQMPTTGTINLRLAATGGSHKVQRVETFAHLARGQLGLLLDANAHLAVVAGQASAAALLAIGTGVGVILTW